MKENKKEKKGMKEDGEKEKRRRQPDRVAPVRRRSSRLAGSFVSSSPPPPTSSSFFFFSIFLKVGEKKWSRPLVLTMATQQAPPVRVATRATPDVTASDVIGIQRPPI